MLSPLRPRTLRQPQALPRTPWPRPARVPNGAPGMRTLPRHRAPKPPPAQPPALARPCGCPHPSELSAMPPQGPLPRLVAMKLERRKQSQRDLWSQRGGHARSCRLQTRHVAGPAARDLPTLAASSALLRSPQERPAVPASCGSCTCLSNCRGDQLRHRVAERSRPSCQPPRRWPATPGPSPARRRLARPEPEPAGSGPDRRPTATGSRSRRRSTDSTPPPLRNTTQSQPAPVATVAHPSRRSWPCPPAPTPAPVRPGSLRCR